VLQQAVDAGNGRSVKQVRTKGDIGKRQQLTVSYSCTLLDGKCDGKSNSGR
jgi:hypothetical protein